jgi:proline dehydrogenase
VRARPLPGLLRLLEGRVAGPAPEDAVALAAGLVRSGRLAALERLPPDAAALGAVVAALDGSRTARAVEVTVAVTRSPDPAALARSALAAGLDVVLDGPPVRTDALAAVLPGARVVVRAAEPGADQRCRALAGGRVRLVQGRAATAPAFARCLAVLMAGAGEPAIAATDPRLVAIAGERAAWSDRPPESWEHVMPYGVRTDEQQRLTAAGARVRVLVPWGPGAATAVARQLAGRS